MREEFIHVAGIVGSLRRDSYNRWLLRAAQQEAPPTLRIAELGLEGIPLYNPDGASPPPPAVQQLKTALYAADAVIIATPEYNHSIPGVLKNALDWLSVPPEENPLEGKPVAIIGATTGNFGTLRAQLHLRQVLSYFNADVLNRPEVLVARAKDHKYLGSKERRAIAELVFGTLRCLELSEFLLQRLSCSVPAGIAREWLLLVTFGILSPAVGNPHIVPLLRTATLSEADSSDSEFWCRLLQVHGWSSAEAEHFYRALRHGLCSLKAAVSQVLELPLSRWEEHHWQQFAAACALPLWLVREWLQHPLNGLSAAQLLSTCQALQRPALPCLRVNTLKAHPAALVELLRQQGITTAPSGIALYPHSPASCRRHSAEVASPQLRCRPH
jgi:chromate reductase